MHVRERKRNTVASPDRGRTCRYERVDPLAETTAPAPPEHPRRNTLWTKPAVRLAVLVACLVALIGVAVARFSGSEPSARGASSCLPSRLPSVPEIGPARLLALRASLMQVVARAGGRRYAGGIAVPLAFWSDEPPHTIGASRAAGGRWPASYEIRQWSGAGDNVATDAFEFADAQQAQRFFAYAGASRCHRAGRSASALAPPNAQILTWMNPDNAAQSDVLLLRGARVYRVAVVRGNDLPALPAARAAKLTVATADRLACELPDAGCTRVPALS
jgi:hypothetical protein